MRSWTAAVGGEDLGDSALAQELLRPDVEFAQLTEAHFPEYPWIQMPLTGLTNVFNGRLPTRIGKSRVDSGCGIDTHWAYADSLLAPLH